MTRPRRRDPARDRRRRRWLGALRGRRRRATGDDPRTRARRCGHVLFVGHDRASEGHPVPAARPTVDDDHPLDHAEEPDRHHRRQRVSVAGADVPHGARSSPARWRTASAPPPWSWRSGTPRRASPPSSATGATAAQFVPTMFVRLLKLPPRCATVRRVVAHADHARRRAVSGRGEAPDDRLARPDHLGVLRGLRERGLHAHRPRRLARPSGLGRPAPLLHRAHLRRRPQRAGGRRGRATSGSRRRGPRSSTTAIRRRPQHRAAPRVGSRWATSATSTTTATST